MALALSLAPGADIKKEHEDIRNLVLYPPELRGQIDLYQHVNDSHDTTYLAGGHGLAALFLQDPTSRFGIFYLDHFPEFGKSFLASAS